MDGKQNEASRNRLTNFEVTAGRSALRAPNHTERHRQCICRGLAEGSSGTAMNVLFTAESCMYSQREKRGILVPASLQLFPNLKNLPDLTQFPL